MVDRQARDIAADVLARFLRGELNNKEYEHQYPESKEDPALREIWLEVWFFYSDLRQQRLNGKEALSTERQEFVKRCILFLRHGTEFRWPRQRFRPWYAALRLVGLGVFVDRWYSEGLEQGDTDVWPFLTRSEYEAATESSFSAAWP